MKPVAEDLEDLAASDMTFSIIRDAIQHHLVLTSQKGGLKVPKSRRKKTDINFIWFTVISVSVFGDLFDKIPVAQHFKFPFQ